MNNTEHTLRIIRALADDISRMLEKETSDAQDKQKIESDREALLYALRKLEPDMTQKQKRLLARAYAEYPTTDDAALKHLVNELTVIFR